MNTLNKPLILYRRFRKEMLLIPLLYEYSNYRFYVLKMNVNDFLLQYNDDFENIPKTQLKELKFPITLYLKDYNVYLNLLITNMNNYPFQVPDIILNNKLLTQYYCSNLFIRFKKYFVQRKCCCLKCDSVLNKEKWNVLTHFRDVIDEMVKNFIDIKRSIEMLHMEKIFQKYIISDDLTSYVLYYI